MKAICASVNFDLFMVFPRPTARITHAAKLESRGFCEVAWHDRARNQERERDLIEAGLNEPLPRR
jgi:hypothetical protein